MRRLLSILLAALLLSPGLTQMSTWLRAGDSESNLPACCRRLGKHHCAMGATHTDESGTPHFQAQRETCPFAPAIVSAGYATPYVAAKHSTDPAMLRSVVLVAVARERMRQPDKATDPSRGPPTILS